MQYLLQYENPIAYSTRAEDWACDYYDIDNICISTGYNYIDSKNLINLDYDTLKSYDNKAMEIIINNDIEYDVKKMQVKELLLELIQLAIANK